MVTGRIGENSFSRLEKVFSTAAGRVLSLRRRRRNANRLLGSARDFFGEHGRFAARVLDYRSEPAGPEHARDSTPCVCQEVQHQTMPHVLPPPISFLPCT
jgi:hypothetical protein